jgi:hypothetical protein
MLKIVFPAKTFVAECEEATRKNEAFEIVVSASCSKVDAVQRSIQELRGEKSRLYRFFSVLGDKWRTIDLWVGLAKPLALDWRLDYARNGDLVVKVSPPLAAH